MYSCLGNECPRIREFVSGLDGSYKAEEVQGLVNDTVAACDQNPSDICAASGGPRQDARGEVAAKIAAKWVDAQTGGHHPWMQPPVDPEEGSNK